MGLPLPLVYQPTDSLAGTVLAPWLIAQLPAALLAAGIYGILEGWLAVDGCAGLVADAPTAGATTRSTSGSRPTI